jgi:NADH:ubiquinone oxidoreductase subunit F (NADH-binding)
MGIVERVLPAEPFTDLRHYIERGGGRGLSAARAVDPVVVIELIEASGLRGRGGAGFPTGRKWRAVAERESRVEATTVVVNGAEGEPGCFKDRAILHANPYAVLEGALIAAHAVGADEVVVAMKHTFERAIERIDIAIGQMDLKGWLDGVKVSIVEGPSEYLFGEETGLLEVIDGRAPFPRTAPPFRHGVDEVVETGTETAESESSSPALVEMASPDVATTAPPALVNNVETLANVPAILVEGAEWFRSVGTAESPGTVVCTVTACVQRDGVGEFAMGTPLQEVIDTLGGGARPNRRLTALMSGVANALVPAARFDTPVSYEGLAAVGSGLGAAGFIVFDDTIDFTAVAAGVARFLAVESCGQCRHCKQDGLELNERLDAVAGAAGQPDDLERVDVLLAQIDDGARCNLASQQRTVVGSVVSLFGDQVQAHTQKGGAPVDPVLITPLVDIADGMATYDQRQRDKQPDWTYDTEYSGKWPADRLAEHRDGDTQL